MKNRKEKMLSLLGPQATGNPLSNKEKTTLLTAGLPVHAGNDSKRAFTHTPSSRLCGRPLGRDIKKCHSRVSLSGIFNACRGCVVRKQHSVEDPRLQISGMTALFDNGKRAFTLIELLVVVLIIGILSAIALPQYRLAILRTKMVQAFTTMHALEQAQQAYYLANGVFTINLEDLGETFPTVTYQSCQWNNSGSRTVLHCHVVLNSISLETNFSSLTGRIMERSCQAPINDSLRNRVCATYGTYRFNAGGNSYYWLSQN